MAPWVSVPGCRTRRPKAGPLMMQSCKDYRAPGGAGQRFQARYFSSSAKCRSSSTMALKSSKSTRPSRSVAERALGPAGWPNASRSGLGRGEQARQRRHDEVEAEVVQLARREQRRPARSRPCWRRACMSGSAAAIASSSSIDSGASTNTASTPTSGGHPPRSIASSSPTAARASVRAVTAGGCGGRPRRAAWRASPHAARPACRPCARSAWATPGPRGRSRPRPPPPRARPCARRSAGCRTRCRRRRRPCVRARRCTTRRGDLGHLDLGEVAEVGERRAGCPTPQ